MPEGDTIFRAARTLHAALAGHRVTRFESALPLLARVDVDRPLAGRTIEGVVSRGKHLLITFSGDLVLHTHMRMNGSWHLYRPGERWRRPRRDMRIVVETEAVVAVGFNIPVAEFLTARQLARHPQIQALGPDLLDPAFDAEAARTGIRAHGNEAIADVLLNQRVLAGIGNVFKSEVLFVAGVYPFAAVDGLDDDTLASIIDVARAQLRANAEPSSSRLTAGPAQRTTGSLHPDRALWVYGRGGLPCRRCGATIVSRKTGIDARLTYWCPACQTRGVRPSSNMRK
jgi:endonuclease-8